jgi:hypothetical protein
MRFLTAVLAALVLVVVIPAIASAASSSLDGYGGPGGATQTLVSDPAAKAPAQSLPFTGSDLLPTVVVGLLLVGLGVGMRRGAPRKDMT